MNQNVLTIRGTKELLALSLTLAAVVALYFASVFTSWSIWQLGVVLVVMPVLGLFIARDPYLGLGIMLGLEMLVSVLPDVPFATSAVSLMGGLTLGAYWLHLANGDAHKPASRPQQTSRLYAITLAFLIWMMASNVEAAFGLNSGSRWIMTYLQLFVLIWLANQLFTTPGRLRFAMLSFAFAAVISAISGINDVLLSQGSSQSGDFSMLRSQGTGESINLISRYYVVALVYLYYFLNWNKHRGMRVLYTVGIVLLVAGVYTTSSRTGILLLIITVLFISLRWAVSIRQVGIISLVLAFLLVLNFLPGQVAQIQERFFEEQGESSVEENVRQDLWATALEVSTENPIGGIGVGQFAQMNRYRVGAHNGYLSVLVETGIPGFVLFAGMIVVSLRGYARIIFSKEYIEQHPAYRELVIACGLGFVIMLLGMFTKDDHYDKMLWLSMGIGTLFASGRMLEAPAEPVPGQMLPQEPA